MDISAMPVSELIPKLDEKRVSMGLSFQNVADACGVSQRTIIRFFRQGNKASPSVDLLQNVIAAVEYEFIQPPIAPASLTNDEYPQYLIQCLEYERDDKRIRLAQQEARANRKQAEHMKIILALAAVILLFTFFVCGVLAYDLSHFDRGWFQAETAGSLRRVILSACGLLRG